MELEYHEWMEDAECSRAQDPEIFFPQGDDLKLHMRSAKEYCDRCMVSAECLEYAVKNRIDDGIFAGMTPRQRRSLRKQTA